MAKAAPGFGFSLLTSYPFKKLKMKFFATQLLALLSVVILNIPASATQVQPVEQNFDWGHHGNTIEVSAFNDLNAGDLILVTLHFIRSVELIELDDFKVIHIETEQGQATGSSRPYVAALYKIATGDEGSFTFTVDGNLDTGDGYAGWGAISRRIVGYDPDNPIGPAAGNNSGGEEVGSIEIGSLLTKTDNSLLIDAGAFHVEFEENQTKEEFQWYSGFTHSSEDYPEELIGGSSYLHTVVSAGSTGESSIQSYQPAKAAALAFVVNNTPPIIPVSKWAVVLGLAFMSIFIVLRVKPWA